MNLLGFDLDGDLERVIKNNKEFYYLDRVSLFCNQVQASEEIFDYFLDLYSQKKQEKFDDFSAKFYALRKSHDFIYYEDLIEEDEMNTRLKGEIEKTQKGFQNIETMINKYIKIKYGDRKEGIEESFFLNNLYFEYYYSSRRHKFAKKWIIEYLRMKIEEDERKHDFEEEASWGEDWEDED